MYGITPVYKCKVAFICLFSLVFAVFTPQIPAAERGTPWTRHTIDDSSRGADGTRLADVDGRRGPDIVTGWEEGGRIRVYLNPGRSGAKEKWPAVTVGQVGSPEDAVFADLDGDGAVDVVSSCEGKVRTMWVHWAPAEPDRYLDPLAWKTEPIPASKGAMMWMFCLPMQIDGRNGIDLVAAGKGPGAQVGWFESPPDPRDLAAWKWHPMRPAGWIMSLVAADMEGDGDQDIVVSDRKGDRRACFWLENPGPDAAAAKPWQEHPIGEGGREFMFLTLADVDRDGWRDVLVAIRGKELVLHSRKSADGLEWVSRSIPLPPDTGTGKGVAVGDIDRDGKADIVFSCENSKGKSGVVWMSRRSAPGQGNWEAHEISGPVGTKYDLVELLDLDGDGDLDVLTCEERENLGVIWYENPLK